MSMTITDTDLTKLTAFSFVREDLVVVSAKPRSQIAYAVQVIIWKHPFYRY